MKTYTAFSKDFDWIEFGSFSKCCALAQDYCRQNFERVAYVGQLRGGEPRKVIFEVAAGKIQGFWRHIFSGQTHQAAHSACGGAAMSKRGANPRLIGHGVSWF